MKPLIQHILDQLQQDYPGWSFRHVNGRWLADHPHFAAIDASNAPALRLRVETSGEEEP